MSDQSEIERLIGDSRLATSEELDRRILSNVPAGLSQASNEVRSATPGRTATRWTRVVPSLAAAMILLLAGLWWASRPDELWAQVVQQVQGKPWMLMRGQAPEGDVEMWFSIPHQTTAVKSPDHISLTRLKEPVSESYTPQTKQLVRQKVTPQSCEQLGFEAFSILFQGLFGGKERLDVDTAFGRVSGIGKVEQSREEVKDEEGTWYDYRITLRPDGEQPSTMTIRVNATTALPSRMTVENANQPPVAFAIEYPETGPADIYALGVPRDVEMVDATPQALQGPAQEIVSQMRAAAGKFDDYRAIIVSSNPDDPWHVGSPVIVWKKGRLSRIDGGFVDPARPPTQPQPDGQADRREWWRTRCRELWFRPVNYCDGESIFENEFVPDIEQPWSFNTHPRTAALSVWGKVKWKKFGPSEGAWPARTSPVVWAYPDLTGYFANPHLYNVQLRTTREPDGRETVLVKLTWPSGDTESEAEYLLDASRDYVVLRRSAVVYATENEARVVQTRTAAVHEDFAQTPGGAWYPTTITDEHFFRQGGDVTEGATVSRYDVEFDVDLPDSLFAAPASSRFGIPQ